MIKIEQITVWAILAGCLVTTVWAAEEPASLNTSFETGSPSPGGTTTPTGWTPVDVDQKASGAVWLDGGGRTGARAVEAASAKGRAVWMSDWTPIDPNHRHIIDGWIKSSEGSAWLEVRFSGRGGPLLGKWRSPCVKGATDWTYVAVETTRLTKAAKGDAPVQAQVAFVVKHGRAALDDVGCHPDAPIELANADFESPLDKKGRMPYWSEETENALLAGERGVRSSGTPRSAGARAGALSADTKTAFRGTASIAVTATDEWFAASAVNYAVWPWFESIELEAMARCEAGAEAQLLVAWTDSAQQLVGVGAGPVIAGDQWQRVSSGEAELPRNAYAFRPVLVVHKKPGVTQATAWFDDADVSIEKKPVVRVVVNQVGYDAGNAEPKKAMVLTNFFPGKTPLGRFEVVGDHGRGLLRAELACAGRMYGQNEADWGWYFWPADFSAFGESGRFRVRAAVGSHDGLSFPFRVGEDVLFAETAEANVDFFFVQRCGYEVPGWHAPCHLDDAKLKKDGAHRDLTGGWHSAGDYNKLTWEYGDGGAVYALVAAAEAAPERFAPYDRDKNGVPDVLDEAWWGAQFLAKVQEPETGGLLNHIEQGPDKKTWMNWCPPEKTTDNIVGTPDDPIVIEGEGNSPLAIGGWARLSKLLEARGVQNDYLARAIRLWEHATARAGAGADPLLLLSSVDLYRVTGEERCLAYSRQTVEGILAKGDPQGALTGGYGDSGDIPAAALAYFALRLPDDPLAPTIKARLERHLPPFLAEARNPLGLMMQKAGADGYFFEPTSAFGCNFQIACWAWSALMVYRVVGDPRALEYATNQLDFILGKNPYDLCMMEGQGSFNLPRYHHRYITIPGHDRGAVPGAIPNGFVRDIVAADRPGVDLSTGGRPYPSYRTDEPWLVHNVFYLLAVTALHEVQSTSSGSRAVHPER